MIITRHAIKRSKERFWLNKAALTRLAEKAVRNHKHDKMIERLFGHYREDTVKIYWEYVFIFKEEALVTVYLLKDRLNRIEIDL